MLIRGLIFFAACWVAIAAVGLVAYAVMTWQLNRPRRWIG